MEVKAAASHLCRLLKRRGARSAAAVAAATDNGAAHVPREAPKASDSRPGGPAFPGYLAITHTGYCG